MPTLTVRQSYRTFGTLYAVVLAIVILARSLAADQLAVGAVATVVIAGAGLAAFWQSGERYHRTGGSDHVAIAVRTRWLDRERIERAGRIAAAAIWFVGVYLLYGRGVRVGGAGIVAVAAINWLVLWRAAIAVPTIERWLKTAD